MPYKTIQQYNPTTFLTTTDDYISKLNKLHRAQRKLGNLPTTNLRNSWPLPITTLPSSHQVYSTTTHDRSHLDLSLTIFGWNTSTRKTHSTWKKLTITTPWNLTEKVLLRNENGSTWIKASPYQYLNTSTKHPWNSNTLPTRKYEDQQCIQHRNTASNNKWHILTTLSLWHNNKSTLKIPLLL